jgi:hypothetical protein
MADILPTRGVAVSIGEEAEALPVLDLARDSGAVDNDLPVLGTEDAAKLPKRAVLNRDGTVTYTLREPVVLRYRVQGAETPTEERYVAFTLRPLRGADMRRIGEAERGDQAVTGIALATGVPVAKMNLIFDRMAAADVMGMSDVIRFLLDGGLTTGP